MSSALATALNSQQDFYMNLLMAQLQNQDPMEPMSNAEMVSQMAQLATLDSMNGLNTSFSEMLELHRLAGGTEMIGREVTYSNGGAIEQDTVQAVSIDGGAISLQLSSGYEIALSKVRSVTQAQES